MRLLVPFVDGLTAAGVRLYQMAGAMGAECVLVQLPRASVNPSADLDGSATGETTCIAICPEVVRAWLGSDTLPEDLASHLVSSFRFVLLHELGVDPVSTSLVRALSEGAVVCVTTVDDPHCGYQVAHDVMCGPFADLKFGPAKKNDCVLEVKSGQQSLHSIISIDGKPLFSKMSGRVRRFFSGRCRKRRHGRRLFEA